MSAPPEAGERRRVRVVGVVVLLGLVVLGVMLFWKVQVNRAAEEALLERGARDLHRALSGEDEAWPRARDAYRQAAGRDAFDPYPAFCLATIDRLEALAAGKPDAIAQGGSDPYAPALVVLAQRRRSDARADVIARAAKAGPGAQARARYLLRLITDLDVAAARDTTGSGAQPSAP